MVTLAACGAVLSTKGCASQPKRDPEQSTIRFQLAVNAYQDRRIEAAITELNEALKADPDNADAHNMLGIIALRQGADYVAQAETLSCLRGRDAELVREDAHRKFKEAEGHFRKAVDLRDDFPMAWNNLSVADLQLQDWAGAVTAASKALASPTYAEPEIARGNLGWAHFHRKDLQRAWKELHEAVARAPGFCVGRYRLAKVYTERGDLDLAAEQLDAVFTDKRCPIQEAYLLGGLVAQRRKEPDKARELLDRCITLAPKSCQAAECRRYAGMVRGSN